jgi:hypothetical protein
MNMLDLAHGGSNRMRRETSSDDLSGGAMSLARGQFGRGNAIVLLAALALSNGLWAAPTIAVDAITYSLDLKDDKFTPGELDVPAGKPFKLTVRNGDATPAEFEAKDLKIEKVMAGNSEISVSVRPLDPGRYLFVNEYKEDTVNGYVVAK